MKIYKIVFCTLVLLLSVSFSQASEADLMKHTRFLEAHEKGLVIKAMQIHPKTIRLFDRHGEVVNCFNPRMVEFEFIEENGENWIVIQVHGQRTTSEEAERNQLKYRIDFSSK